jgi:hypothetical protein
LGAIYTAGNFWVDKKRERISLKRRFINRDIRLPEIISLEQQRFTRFPGERVGEAVPEIQPGRMPALTEIEIGLASDLRLVKSNGRDLYSRTPDKSVKGVKTRCVRK